MIIETTNELNKLIASFGDVDLDKLIELLADKKIVLSPVIARLVQDKAAWLDITITHITHITHIIKV